MAIPMCLLALLASGGWAAGGGGMNDPHTRAMCAAPSTIHHILQGKQAISMCGCDSFFSFLIGWVGN
jgi:hypothetical protein